MGKVLAVCISEKKGTQKKNVGSAVFVEDWGLEGDAHAGKWHRQVSLLSSTTTCVPFLYFPRIRYFVPVPERSRSGSRRVDTQ